MRALFFISLKSKTNMPLMMNQGKRMDTTQGKSTASSSPKNDKRDKKIFHEEYTPTTKHSSCFEGVEKTKMQSRKSTLSVYESPKNTGPHNGAKYGVQTLKPNDRSSLSPTKGVRNLIPSPKKLGKPPIPSPPKNKKISLIECKGKMSKL